jgi:hypothetical protein
MGNLCSHIRFGQLSQLLRWRWIMNYRSIKPFCPIGWHSASAGATPPVATDTQEAEAINDGVPAVPEPDSTADPSNDEGDSEPDLRGTRPATVRTPAPIAD